MGPKTLRDLLLVILAGCAGALDAVCYLRLHAFAANMTGNTVLLGLNLGGRQEDSVPQLVVALAAFFAGSLAGTAAGGEAAEDDLWPAQTLRAFALEVVLLAGFVAFWMLLAPGEPRTLLALACVAAAMGIQSGITHDIHHHGASTTYMSGTLARSAEFIVDSLRFGFRGDLVLNAVTWLIYLIAACAVGALDVHGGSTAGIVVTATLLIAAVALAARPIVRAGNREADPPSRRPPTS